jgi:hypothetical protein
MVRVLLCASAFVVRVLLWCECSCGAIAFVVRVLLWCECSCGASAFVVRVLLWCECFCDVRLCSLLCCSLCSASALVTFICVLCTLCTQISQHLFCNSLSTAATPSPFVAFASEELPADVANLASILAPELIAGTAAVRASAHHLLALVSKHTGRSTAAILSP